MVFRQAEIEFGVEVLGGVYAHLKSSAGEVVAHLHDAFFHFGGIVCVEDVVFEIVVIDFFCFLLVAEHQQCFVVMSEDVVDVDADEYLDLGNVA